VLYKVGRGNREMVGVLCVKGGRFRRKEGRLNVQEIQKYCGAKKQDFVKMLRASRNIRGGDIPGK